MMLKRTFSTTFIKFLCACLFLSSCGSGVHEEGSGTISEETRNVGAFFNLDIEGNYDIVLQEGTNPLITIQTDENLHQYIETTIDGETLKIRNVEKIEASEDIRLIVTYQNLESISLGKAAKITNRGVLNAKELGIRIGDAAVVDLSLKAEELDLKLSGAGAVNLRGAVDKQTIELSGAGNLAAYELESKDCKIELSGVGVAQLLVTDDLQAEVSGVGVIRFKGDPRNISREISGTGTITRVADEN